MEDWKGRSGNEEKSETCLGNRNRGGAQENMKRVSQWETQVPDENHLGKFSTARPQQEEVSWRPFQKQGLFTLWTR